MTDLQHLARALVFRTRKVGLAYGHAQVQLRQEIMGETPDTAEAAKEFERLMSVRINDMPPESDDLSLLLDCLIFRKGFSSRADAWRSIGINPNTGRDLLGRNGNSVGWPVWKTLRDEAFGFRIV